MRKVPELIVRSKWLPVALTAVTVIAAAGYVVGGEARGAGPKAALGCDVASIQAVSPSDTTIVSAVALDKPVSHCRVDGYVTTTNPGPNRNNFRLQLPERSLWKHRFYFVGLGGAAGYVPTDSQIPAGNPMVQGFAVAGTDTGHQAPGLDWGFLSDPAKAIDYTWRGAHLTTVAAQQITKAYYGASKIFRYHMGCSGGGRMGAEAIMHHPEDYDGVMIGGGDYMTPVNPNPEPAALRGGFVSMVHEMTREPGSWLSPAKLKFAEEKVTAACDLADGAKDDMIWDHRLCKFDFSSLKCKSGDGPDCLTQPEITSFNNLLRDTHMPISNLSTWSFLGSTPPPWDPSPDSKNLRTTSSALVIQTTWARAYLGQPERDIVKTPLTDDELVTIAKEQRKSGFNTPVNPDLNGIEKAGAKVFLWNGVSDPCCWNVAQENVYKHWAAVRGGDMNRVAKFARVYHFPGMGHCSGGTGPDDAPDQLIRAMIDWVEQGKAPEAIVVHRGADRAKFLFTASNDVLPGLGTRIPRSQGVPRDFLICPFPLVSVFDKSKANIPGAVYDAANWSCRRSRT